MNTKEIDVLGCSLKVTVSVEISCNTSGKKKVAKFKTWRLKGCSYLIEG
jgi:hypothetical protein